MKDDFYPCWSKGWNNVEQVVRSTLLNPSASGWPSEHDSDSLQFRILFDFFDPFEQHSHMFDKKLEPPICLGIYWVDWYFEWIWKYIKHIGSIDENIFAICQIFNQI